MVPEQRSSRLPEILDGMGRYLAGMAAETAFIAALMLLAFAAALAAVAIW